MYVSILGKKNRIDFNTSDDLMKNTFYKMNL